LKNENHEIKAKNDQLEGIKSNLQRLSNEYIEGIKLKEVENKKLQEDLETRGNNIKVLEAGNNKLTNKYHDLSKEKTKLLLKTIKLKDDIGNLKFYDKNNIKNKHICKYCPNMSYKLFSQLDEHLKVCPSKNKEEIDKESFFKRQSPTNGDYDPTAKVSLPDSQELRRKG
jgi:hypothetical protein